MNAMRKYVVRALAVSLVVGGCATIDPNYFRNQSTMELCMGLMRFPSYNVNHPARMQELSRRGENCSQYTGAASAQAEKDRQMIETIRAVTPPPPPKPVTCYTNPNGSVTCY